MLKSSTLATTLCLLAFSPLVASSQNVATGIHGKMIAPKEYSLLLDRTSKDLVDWETTLQRVDPGNDNVSYNVGTEIEGFKKVGLIEIGSARTAILQQREKRTIYGELELADTIDGIEMSLEELAYLGSFNDRSQDSVNKEAAEINLVLGRLKSDAVERVRLLENNSCAGLKP